MTATDIALLTSWFGSGPVPPRDTLATTWGSIDWSTAPSGRQDGAEDVNRREDGSRKWHEVILLDHEHPTIENDDDLDWIRDDSRGGRPFRGKTGAGVRTRNGRPRQGDRAHPPEPLSDGRRGK